MLNSDTLETFEGGAESRDFTFFGAFLAIGLTLAGVAIPMYVAGQTGRIFIVCVALAPFLVLASLYFLWKGLDIRSKVKTKIQHIKDESKTVLEMIATEASPKSD